MKKIRMAVNTVMFGICAAAGGLGLVNAKPVLAAESAGEEMVVSDAASDDAVGELSENSWGGVSKSGNTAEDESLGVYDFKDNKTTGTVTVTKVWDDDKTNEERVIPDIKISTEKPGKNPLGYTITFHGNKDAGLVFDDGSDVNEVVYNSSGQIVDGVFKVPEGVAAGAVSWFTDEALTNKVDVSEDGTVQMALSGDVDLWGKVKTVEIKGYKQGVKNNNEFNALIPDTVTEVLFTDEIKPDSASVIDVDADGDGGVIAWTENNDTVMKVSTQIKGMKVQAAKDSENMFWCYGKRKLTNIGFSMLDTSKVTNMGGMFSGCSNITKLDLSYFDTSNVTNMSGMFGECNGLTSLDLSSFDTSKVTNMNDMFSYCKNLTNINLSHLNTSKVTNMNGMFYSCSGLISLDLSMFETSNVTNMCGMFNKCSSLINLNLNHLCTTNVTNMNSMFGECFKLTSLNLSNFDTSNVTNMGYMFYYSGLTSIDLTNLNTSNVTNMQAMFYGCYGLTNLDLSTFDTSNVTDMAIMFNDCTALTTITTGPNFKFVGQSYSLSGTWQNTAGETFTSGSFPSNVADTYTKISS